MIIHNTSILNNLTKSAERFSGCLRVLIHLMPTFHEHCSSLHQS